VDLLENTRKMKAWLVTWEWVSDHAKRDDKIAAVLNSRLSESRVKKLVEFLYANDSYAVSEKMAVAQRRRDNPYPAKVERGVITCGHHPFLQARLVDDLRVEYDGHGMETAIAWKERSGTFKRVSLTPKGKSRQ
jgi:hypothetical protein